MKHLYHSSLTLMMAVLVSGCAVATAGMKKGDERSFVGSIKDVNAGRVIEARMTRALDYKLKGVDVEVAEGIVVLTGNVPTQKDKIEAARIAWSARGIEQVGNEVIVGGKQSFIRNTKDGFLEKSVRARLLADKLVKARNFNIETHDGIVYVLGVARTNRELKRAAKIAATTKGARQVISYARIADLPAAKRLELEEQAYATLNPRRELPSILQVAPSGPVPQAPSYDAQVPAPITNLPMNEPIPFSAPTAPNEIAMGDRLGKELPSDEELGAYRTGQAGEAVSIIESAPYYIDPDTGKEIPIRFDNNGNIVPLIIK
jgi:osmotically-inducible protein OsmY